MQHPAASERFWSESTTVPFVAVNPHRSPEESDGLVEFAESNEGTRGLIYFQTSGSEGLPKWVGLSRAACLASARAVNAHLECNAADRWLVALPLHHVGGFSILARAVVAGAGLVEFQGRWNAERFTQQCREDGVTLTSLVPSQVYDLVQHRCEAPACLRAIVVGGGALSREMGHRALELGWPVLQSYGMTETASQVATEPLEHLRAGFDPDSLEALPGWDLSLTDEGSLVVRGDALAAGYAIRQDGGWRWEPLDAEGGGLVTRDRVDLWTHGTRRFLRFRGRAASFVKVLGELVSLPALQSRLETLLTSMDLDPRCAVVWPVRDERADSRLVLVGEGSAELLEAVRSQYNTSVPGYERLHATVQVDSIPRSALGKVDAQAVERLVQA